MIGEAIQEPASAYRDRTRFLRLQSLQGAREQQQGKADPDAHPQHPTVQAEPIGWQPGRRGRPPKGVLRKRDGTFKFPAGYRNINGLWHAPLNREKRSSSARSKKKKRRR